MSDVMDWPLTRRTPGVVSQEVLQDAFAASNGGKRPPGPWGIKHLDGVVRVWDGQKNEEEEMTDAEFGARYPRGAIIRIINKPHSEAT